MMYGVISGGKKIRSSIILDTGKFLILMKKSLLIFVLLLNVFIHIH